MTMRHQVGPPIVFANPARVKVMAGGDANGEELADLGPIPGGIAGHETDIVAQAAEQFRIEQPFQDLGGQYMSSEEFGSWKNVVSHGDQDI